MSEAKQSQFAQLQAIAKDLIGLRPGGDADLLDKIDDLQRRARRALKTPAGNPNIADAIKKSVKARKASAQAYREMIQPHIAAARAGGAKNNEQIAAYLNEKGLRSASGGDFTRAIVHKLVGN